VQKQRDPRLTHETQARFVRYVQQQLHLQNKSVATLGVSRFVFYTWRTGKHRVGKHRATQILTKLGARWRDLGKKPPGQVDVEPGVPAHADFAWELATVLTEVFEVTATISTENRSDAPWFVKVLNTQIIVAASGWCEVFHETQPLLAGDYSQVFKVECRRVLKLLTTTTTRKRKRTGMSISRLQKKMRTLHLMSDDPRDFRNR
jgi:hypothetical protein